MEPCREFSIRRGHSLYQTARAQQVGIILNDGPALTQVYITVVEAGPEAVQALLHRSHTMRRGCGEALQGQGRHGAHKCELCERRQEAVQDGQGFGLGQAATGTGAAAAVVDLAIEVVAHGKSRGNTRRLAANLLKTAVQVGRNVRNNFKFEPDAARRS